VRGCIPPAVAPMRAFAWLRPNTPLNGPRCTCDPVNCRHMEGMREELWLGLVWLGIAGLAWLGIIWLGLVWLGLGLGLAWLGFTWLGPGLRPFLDAEFPLNGGSEDPMNNAVVAQLVFQFAVLAGAYLCLLQGCLQCARRADIWWHSAQTPAAAAEARRLVRVHKKTPARLPSDAPVHASTHSHILRCPHRAKVKKTARQATAAAVEARRLVCVCVCVCMRATVPSAAPPLRMLSRAGRGKGSPSNCGGRRSSAPGAFAPQHPSGSSGI
jgi:hypothetical protein